MPNRDSFCEIAANENHCRNQRPIRIGMRFIRHGVRDGNKNMERRIRNVKGSLYLVVDPMPGLKIILPKIKAALEGGVDILQLWNHWNETESQEELILQVCDLAHSFHVPVIIHEHWQY